MLNEIITSEKQILKSNIAKIIGCARQGCS